MAAEATGKPSTLFSIIKLIRPPHWVKNVVIFFPILFGREMTNGGSLFDCLMGFLAFCFLASVVYVVNDIADVESDRQHPTKVKRPIASGAIPVPMAYSIAGALLLLTAIICYAFLPANACLYLGLYFILNLLYSFRLKSIALLDVFMIAVFFEIRLFLGGELSSIEISHWLSMLTFFLATFIAFSKRHDDVMLSMGTEKSIRKSIKNYNIEYLNAILLLLATVILIVYVLYAISDEGGMKYNSNFYMTSFFVFLGICRYLQLIYVHKRYGNPVKIFYTDATMLFTWLGWLATIVYFIYF